MKLVFNQFVGSINCDKTAPFGCFKWVVWVDKKYLDKLFLFSHHLNYVLHYGPLEFSKNGEAVINYRFGIPDHSFPEPTPDDPLSLIDKVGAKLKGSDYESIFRSTKKWSFWWTQTLTHKPT